MRRDKEEILKEVARIQKNWQYRCVVKTKEIEAWECKSPEDINYAFLISMSRWGITVCGDITSPLVFRVGIYQYGMGFLAHNDVEYYMCSKLDQTSRREELDEERFQEVLLGQIITRIDDLYSNNFLQRMKKKFKKTIEAKPYLEKLASKMESRYDSKRDKETNEFWTDLDNLFFSFPAPENAHEAYTTLNDLSEMLDYHDWWECKIVAVEYGVIFSLYMVNHAAKQILAIGEGK